MSIPRIAGLCVAALLAGCASSGSRHDAGPDGVSAAPSAASAAASSGASCRSNRSGCLYNGAYESGERDYAQQQAAKLNLAELQRLKNGFGK